MNWYGREMVSGWVWWWVGLDWMSSIQCALKPKRECRRKGKERRCRHRIEEEEWRRWTYVMDCSCCCVCCISWYGDGRFGLRRGVGRKSWLDRPIPSQLNSSLSICRFRFLTILSYWYKGEYDLSVCWIVCSVVSLLIGVIQLMSIGTEAERQ